MDGIYVNLNNPTNNGAAHYFGVPGYATVSFQIEGTFTAGNYTPQVSNDGKLWASIPAIQSDGTPAATVNAEGLYRCDVNGYSLWKLLPSSDMSAVCTVQSFASQEVMKS